ncbi:cysteine-rich protein 2-binding protein [Eurosta solidaginis]|uniref:cysteine-rich protein 2-binding protein n=1 Tax=Eurosta solidaginis TaxID=178769 RepID=UPI0035309C50
MDCCYCNHMISDSSDDYLECLECQCVVHARCLRTCRPGDLMGDVFFDFTCADCMNLQYNMPSTSTSAKNAPARENFVRQRLSWFMVVTLTLYNLSIKSKGLSHHGFFHWRSHIASFINKNWDFLMEPGTRRRKNWFGSISGNLSHYSPDFFLSGQEAIQKSGWWRLTHTNLTPKMIQRRLEEFSKKRAQMRSEKKQIDDYHAINDEAESKYGSLVDSDDDLPALVGGCSRTMPYMGRQPKIAKQLNIVDDDIKNLPQQPLNTVQSSLMDFLAENLDSYDIFGGADEKSDILPLLDAHHINNNNTYNNIGMLKAPEVGKYNGQAKAYDTTLNKVQQKLTSTMITELNQEDSMQTLSACSNEDDDDDDDEECQARIIKVTNFQSKDHTNAITKEHQLLLEELEQDIKQEIESDTEQASNIEEKRHDTNSLEDNDCEQEIEEGSTTLMSSLKPSLFTKTARRTWPWLLEQAADEAEVQKSNNEAMEGIEQKGSLVMMSEYEEIDLLNQLRDVFALEHEGKVEIPAYVRRFYRKLCVRNFKREHGKPLFNLDDHINGKCSDAAAQIIDRYQLLTDSTSKKYKTFYARIAGSFDYEMFKSPYSLRILHPFIFRDEEIAPPWLQLMCELQYRVNEEYPTRSTIDFCYVRPNHIAAVNALLQSTFWPGIDMSECLSYPDYSVVALYKKLVVGCGFLVPDVGFNEAYISFMAVRPNWQRSGIGTFMLYHLIQTCMTKDITLHVSASNPAIVLYQKFGFKIEEVIHDFYEKYLPIHSKESRTAFFLRLLRS